MNRRTSVRTSVAAALAPVLRAAESRGMGISLRNLRHVRVDGDTKTWCGYPRQAGHPELRQRRTERPPPALPDGTAGGQRRTMVGYECAAPAGDRQLKVLWNGPAELDRVEIYHR